MQCPNEAFARLFYNVSSSFLLFFIFFHITSIFLAKFFICIGGNPFERRRQGEYEFGVSSDDDIEEENEHYGYEFVDKNHPTSDVSREDEALIFVPHSEEASSDSEETSIYSTPADEDYDIRAGEDDLSYASEASLENGATSFRYRFGFNQTETTRVANNDLILDEKYDGESLKSHHKIETNFKQENDSLVFQPSKFEGKKLPEEKVEEEIYGDSFTVGSTSKDSSEWRSSIYYRDSGTDDPFSSSSRRSCPKWESYTIFQKYDEEMLFLDRISAQKLQETDSLRSIPACPRSMSERIVHKLSARSKKSRNFCHNPYNELEATYVAQICLTWEALNWNYKYFQRLRASRDNSDVGCPAYVAQQFQQFQVLLQRYIENEPFEHGRRPEVYARIRSLAPKLLQVPEFRDSDESFCSRISSDFFLLIMEEAIRTFMNFLKQDREKHCKILAAFLMRNRRGSSDAALLLLLKKVNEKKKAKLNELRSSGTCLKRRRRLKEEEEMEILMALVDLKVVSRVLRMKGLNDEQLRWCENKLSKVRVSDGKLQRDFSPIFFPAH